MNEKINWYTFTLALVFAFVFAFVFSHGGSVAVVFALSVFTLYCFLLRVPKIESYTVNTRTFPISFPPRKVSVIPFTPIRKFKK